MILGHYLAGNLTRQVVMLCMQSLPIVVISIWPGDVVHKVRSGERYTICVKVLLLILSARLLYSVLGYGVGIEIGRPPKGMGSHHGHS